MSEQTTPAGTLGCPWHGGPCGFGCSEEEQVRCLWRQGEKLPPWPEFKAWKEASRGK